MGYLDQLKNISNVPDDGPKETKEFAKPNCLGFLGSSYGVLEKIRALESSSRWLLHFSDRNPLDVVFSPAATHDEVLDAYPDALAAEPIERDLGRAGDDPDDRRCCSRCLNLRYGVCVVARPGGLVSAIVGYRPALPDMRQHCAGYSPNADDPDQRPGRERWPGLTDMKGAK